MSGIGEFAYTLLLGWMRALVDWLWSMFSGTGNVGVWQWFLSNWKLWLIMLVVGGLVVDWLMWVVRWRPYRLLLSRFRRAAPAGAADGEAWDSGVGYYEAETAMDTEAPDWTDTTFATLSEIDPDWAGNVVITEDDDPLYDPEYNPPKTIYNVESNVEPPQTEGFYDDEDPEDAWPVDSQPTQQFDPYAPYDAYAEAPAETEFYPETYDEQPYDEAPVKPEPYMPEPPIQAEEPTETTGPVMYGRPGLWPGAQYPFAQQDSAPAPEAFAAPAEDDYAPEPAPEPYDPLFNPDAPAPAVRTPRRRRRLHEAAPHPWEREMPGKQISVPRWVDTPLPPSDFDPDETAYQITRQEPDQRITGDPVRGAERNPPKKKASLWARSKKKDAGPMTVTGKPAKPKGLRRFTSLQDEAIHGLPPLDLTDPFLPAAQPDNPDFVPDEGEEYDS